MIPAAIVSCGYLLFGSGFCIYRLIKHSNDTFQKLLPQFVTASIGTAAIGGRSLHALIYNIFWRSYPIDPRLITEELKEVQDYENIVDWILHRTGVASIIYSFYHCYGCPSAGILIVISVTAIELLCSKQAIFHSGKIRHGELSAVRDTSREFSAIVGRLPYPVAMSWILSSELIGRMMGNHYCRLANVPFGISMWAFPQQGFYKGWSIADCVNDYMMLCYIILMTEALLQMPIVDYRAR